MKFAQRIWQSTIYKRLIIAFMVAILPIYIIAGILYNWTSSLLRQDIVNSVQNQADNFILDLSDTINRFNSLQYDLLNDRYLNQLIHAHDILETYRKVELIHFLRAKLVSIQNSSDLIGDVRLYLPGINIEISSIDGYGLMKERSISPEKLKDPYNLISNNGRLLIVAYPLEAAYKDLPEIIVEIELRSTELRRNLRAALEKEYTGAIVFGIGADSENIVTVYDDSLREQIMMIYSHTAPVESNNLIYYKPSDELIARSLEEQYIFVRSDFPKGELFIDHYLNKAIIYESISGYAKWFWVFFTLTLLLVVLYLYYINRIINKPIVKLVRAFRRVEDGNLELNIRHEQNDEFGYLYERFNEMLINLKVSIDEIYNQQLHRKNAELKQLQSQINPHFLYNCLFSIIRLIKMQKDEEAVQFTTQLAKYFQFITRNTRDMVPLENDVEHARNYVMLQLARFSNRVSVEFEEVPEEIKPISVPRLIIQPLVENAFVHGLENVSDNGLLRVSFLFQHKTLVVVVEDNGESAEEGLEKLAALLSSEQEVQEVTGILNVHRRLQFRYGSRSGLQASRSKLGGIKIKMIIDLEGEETSHVSNADRGG